MKGTRFTTSVRHLLFVVLVSVSHAPEAYEHDQSQVHFQAYTDDVVLQNTERQRPYFLLFSAQWCHWCHLFAERTLSRADVYTYLNTHFTNIFIDADIHTVATVKYNVTGLPYVVFLKPDGSVHFKYAGTLYGDDFVDVIREIQATVAHDISIPADENTSAFYAPPESLNLADLRALDSAFREGILDNFDPLQFGVGRGEKAVLPRTFLYLLENMEDESRALVINQLEKTFARALASIYDPLEGGFFRYAETRDWKIPHYEKMADLNAGAVLALYKLNEHSNSKQLENAATRTIGYLKSALFYAQVGAFRSFQEADALYFLQDIDARKEHIPPDIADKIFTDRLATTLLYLIEVLSYTSDTVLAQQVQRSLDFLADMVEGQATLKRYYALPTQKWHRDSLLREHALVARVFQKASGRFAQPRYARLSETVLNWAVERFYDSEKRIFIDQSIVAETSVEYLMEMNGLLALTMMGLTEQGARQDLERVEGVITYFSGVGVVLEDRLWDSEDWELLEAYVPYLEAINTYLPTRTVGGE